MMNYLIIIDSCTFIILGLIHFYWAFGETIALNKALLYMQKWSKSDTHAG